MSHEAEGTGKHVRDLARASTVRMSEARSAGLGQASLNHFRALEPGLSLLSGTWSWVVQARGQWP